MNHHSSRMRRALARGVAGGMVGSFALLAAGPGTTPARADDGAGTATAGYGGFTVQAWSAPIRVQMFEPSIPIPVDAGQAQVEFDLGYSKVKADSGESRGRASLFWPGDPVGEGLKTFAEQLGLPPNPLTDNGYPMQVNSQFPGDTPTQKDESVPGAIMRTTSGDKTATAETGFSPDGTVVGPDGAAAPEPGTKNGLMDLLNGVTGLLTGGLGGLPGAPAAPTARAAAPGLPPELAALVDIDGYVSTSKMDATGDKVVGVSRSTLGEIRLLGGLVTLGGVETVARTTSDGTAGTATGKTLWGGMTIAGQQFGIGPDGAVTPGGTTTPLPGLDKLPLDALKALGISIEVPQQVRTVEGDAGTSVSEGLRITIDTLLLSPLLKALPTNILAELVPAQAGPLKGVVSGLSNLAPRVVITLGVAEAKVDTVPPIELSAPPPTAEAAPPAAAEQAAPPPAEGGVGVPPAAAPAPIGAVTPAGSAPTGELADAAPTGAGLPELFSIPGMLLVAAFALAAVAGSWFRRIGAAALGLGGSCPHGLDSGLPDLRKA
ncbi:choice-of-anchor P family protein [Nocardioides sp. R1-1]|uniref:choice-of-anchor P family protein n=1 Tax=Nocardioides sp. R1-1 TaxID=3383502 RepID=UPI0038D1C7FA